MNNPFSNSNWRELSPWRILLVLVVIIVGLYIVKTVLLSTMGGRTMSLSTADFAAPGAPMVRTQQVAYEKGYSTNTSMPYPDTDEYAVGDDAEEYEAVSYNAYIKKKDIGSTCDTVEELKPLTYVVFENKDRGEARCSYRFKVERERAEEIAEKIEALNPYDFTTNIHTEKSSVTYFEGRLEIMLQQQEMYKEMLESVNSTYDGAIELSATPESAEALATLINDKIRYIKQLNNDRINLATQLQSLARSSAEVQDKIEYTNFYVQVNEYKVINIQALKDSWVHEAGKFVSAVNHTLQLLTIGLFNLLLGILIVFTYATVIVFTGLLALRFGKLVVKRVIKKKDVPHYESH